MYLVRLRNSQMIWMCGTVSCHLETTVVRHLNFLRAQIDHSGCSTNRRPKSGVLQNAQQSQWKMEGTDWTKIVTSRMDGRERSERLFQTCIDITFYQMEKKEHKEILPFPTKQIVSGVTAREASLEHKDKAQSLGSMLNFRHLGKDREV